MTSYIVTLQCADRPGLIHHVTGALLGLGGNITENAQFVEPETLTFCMRMVVDLDATPVEGVEAAIRGAIAAEPTHLRVRDAADRPRTLILVSKQDHCLADLLYRRGAGTLPIDLRAVASNHETCRSQVEAADVPFVHLPITPETKPAQEARILELVERHQIDLVVLARYMQILSDDLCRRLAGRAINIHHSFLPGFKGAKPYHQAYKRGVKLVGATAHFVTADLDEGPIIEQGVERVSHSTTPRQLVELGQDTERLVLARAVRLFAEDRVLLLGDKTVVLAA